MTWKQHTPCLAGAGRSTGADVTGTGVHRIIIRGDLTGDADATGAVAEAMLEAGGWFTLTLTATVDTRALRREVGLSLRMCPEVVACTKTWGSVADLDNRPIADLRISPWSPQ